MSDLAPFVAAAIRDRVVLELQKENARLLNYVRPAAEDIHEVLALDAMHGLSGTLRVAITGPTNPYHEGGDATTPVVYAVHHVDRRGIDQTETGFVKVNNCTLGDLAHAEIHANGDRCGPLRGFTIDFTLYIEAVDAARSNFDTLEDVPARGSDHHWGYFQVHVNGPNVGWFCFELPNVSKDLLFEFSLQDRREFLANPKPLEIGRRVRINDIINFFGPDTPVVFEADGIFFD